MKHVSPHRNSRLAVILSETTLIVLWGNAAMAMSLNSPAFQQNVHIPSKYTCEGEDVSPPLAWEGVPNGTKSLVLIIDDPDAPDPEAPKMVWVHWVLYNIPPDTKSLHENAGNALLSQGDLLGPNDFKRRVMAARVRRSAATVTFIALRARYHARSNRRDQIADRASNAGPYWPMQSSSARIERVAGSHGTPSATTQGVIGFSVISCLTLVAACW
jgi:phosphatidylethanolamine-binding protein (PEBP) family uncharacterized protein